MIPATEVARLRSALPFWMSLLLVPVAILGAVEGGWTVILLPVITWYFFSFCVLVLDKVRGVAVMLCYQMSFPNGEPILYSPLRIDKNQVPAFELVHTRRGDEFVGAAVALETRWRGQAAASRDA